jgi:protocatechuate 3,4-dioxygenase beta subunit
MHDTPDGDLIQDLRLFAMAPSDRRTFLRGLLAAAVAPLVGCAGGSSTDDGQTVDTGPFTCAEVPTETAGPYPGDGSNGPNILAESGVVRQDITASLDGGGVAAGVPLRVRIRITDAGADCAALGSYAVYLWHADAQGRYSMYSSGVTDETYLRGVQEGDDEGWVVFDTIFPGCYDGRWPHIHFEVFRTLASATSSSAKIATSQLALPQATCEVVYGDSRYPDSATNLGKVSLASDNVFSDGAEQQLPSVTGSNADGWVAELTIAVSA